MTRWGVYVHVPWCRRRCPYCAFYVEADRDVPWLRFVDAVVAEHDAWADRFPGPAHTVFLGGGTPSRMPQSALAHLLEGLPRVDGAEVTVECNPEDATDAWLDGALAAGVTRISLGVQTFNPAFARLLNRACTVSQARQTVARVAERAPSWSFDLIFALPGQTLADLDRDLDDVIASGAPHVALYGLTIEPGTPFERGRDRGVIVPPDDDTWRAMYDRIVDRLEGAGLHRYEVSNFARPGHESRHNRLYWTDAPYLGLGPSAHGYLPDGRRTQNVRDVARYLHDADAHRTIETPTPHEAAIDLLISALRGREGVDLDRMEARTGLVPDPQGVARLAAAGLVAMDGRRLRLTHDGFPVADGVITHLAQRLIPAEGLGSPSGGL